MASEALPNEEQRKQLCWLLGMALKQMRYLKEEQAHALADALHNLPDEMYSGRLRSGTRNLLKSYQEKYKASLECDYLAAFDRIVESQGKALPNEEQRAALCDLMSEAFVELRYLDGEQAHDLAYAFHNLPKEIYGWGSWSVAGTRTRFEYYEQKHKANLGFKYVAAFDKIFPPS